MMNTNSSTSDSSQSGAQKAQAHYDVIVVGYGPAGEVLASTLGAAGLQVLVVERWPTAYGLPRLTTVDGGVFRLVQATGNNIDKAFDSTLVQEACNFVDADCQPLITVQFPGEIGGWPSRLSMYQPDIEQSIADKVDTMSNVTLMRGWECVDMWHQGEEVHLIITPTGGDSSKGSATTVRAKYIVGADGARSFVRQALGLGMTDHGVHERWLNYDTVHLKEFPEQFLNLDIYLDPKRPHMYMPIGKRGLRFEFRVMEDETDEDVTKVGVAEDFMRSQYGLDPANFRIIRRVVYHYRTRMAETWRVKRALLAGDAAHLMPPYLGQGASSAMRDARNLAWKLIEVVSGRSNDTLLDDYQLEQKPYFHTLQMAATHLSHAVNMVDAQKAQMRNKGMRADKSVKQPILPNILAGVVQLNDQGELAPSAGIFTPQGRLRRGDQEALGDDILGTGFQVWCRKDPSTYLGETELAYLATLGATYGVFDDVASPHAAQDLQGLYTGFLDAHGVDIVIVRPDFHAFGGAKEAQANALVKQLAKRLHSTHAIAE